jgi:Na+/proline symporter
MAINVIWRFGIRFNVEALSEIHEVFPAFLVSFLVYIVVSKLSSNRVPDEKHLALVFGSKTI